MRHTLFLSLRDDVSLMPGQDRLTIRSRDGELVVDDATPTTVAVLQRLRAEGGDETALIDLILNDDGPVAMARFCHLLAVLSRRCLLIRTAQANDDEPLASVVPVSCHFEWSSNALVPGRAYVLSRFAYLRRDGQAAVLESPRCHARLVLHHWSASAVTHALMRPRTIDEVTAAVTGSFVGAVDVFMTLLLRAGFLADITEGGASSEDEDQALQSWEFHDLLFHGRTREGRHDRASGATYRFVPRLPAPPALKTADASDWIDLARPAADVVESRALTFDAVHEQRRSVRAYRRCITTEQLGEFLFRVARVKRCCDADIDTPNGPTQMSLALRPFPSAGAVYELELYAAVHSCDGLAQGLYYYDPLGHRLGRTRGNAAHVAQLLSSAGHAAAIHRDELQILILLTARFQRIAWKYESIAYALVLKNVGALLQTMYLVATEMELAPCALGSGDADMFALAGGTDYYTETSVGEFLLGGSVREDAIRRR